MKFIKGWEELLVVMELFFGLVVKFWRICCFGWWKKKRKKERPWFFFVFVPFPKKWILNLFHNPTNGLGILWILWMFWIYSISTKWFGDFMDGERVDFDLNRYLMACAFFFVCQFVCFFVCSSRDFFFYKYHFLRFSFRFFLLFSRGRGGGSGLVHLKNFGSSYRFRHKFSSDIANILKVLMT